MFILGVRMAVVLKFQTNNLSFNLLTCQYLVFIIVDKHADTAGHLYSLAEVSQECM